MTSNRWLGSIPITVALVVSAAVPASALASTGGAAAVGGQPVTGGATGGAGVSFAAPASAPTVKRARTSVRRRGHSFLFGQRVLRLGMRGPDVRTLQRDLNVVSDPVRVDGIFGPGTRASVETFEASNSFRVRGIVTRAEAHAIALAAAAGLVNPPVTALDVTGGATADNPAVNLPPGSRAILNPDGTATAPADAPLAVQQIIAAGNKIAKLPYIYGGGHGSWNSPGYDCSGSVSYALHGAGLLNTPEDSTQLESYGQPGPGTWVTIYANAGHAFMIVAGLRFDTSGQSQSGSRWQDTPRSTRGYVVTHPVGL